MFDGIELDVVGFMAWKSWHASMAYFIPRSREAFNFPDLRFSGTSRANNNMQICFGARDAHDGGSQRP
jgi:hypothetical protein